MKIALVNPSWSFDGSIYFGCRSPHLALELGYAAQLLEADGHESHLIDAHMMGMSNHQAADTVAALRADMTVVTTAPSYLFWRCAPPELRVPAQFLAYLGKRGGTTIAVGPHGSVTPQPTARKLGVDLVIRGECEEAIRELAASGGSIVPGVWRTDDADGRTVVPRAVQFVDAPPLRWPDSLLQRHTHHHHRFDLEPDGLGAEVEASRGCPFSCTFCAKIDFRDRYRRRMLPNILAEIDGLISQGVTYVYFIDEIFLPDMALLENLARRDVRFGVQTRLDLWKPQQIDLLGRAGCVSIEAGIESLTEIGRADLAKKCKATTAQLTELLVRARKSVPFVQANLIQTASDDASAIAHWRESLRDKGVWSNDPVPLYPYPSSPEYRRLFGLPDERAWERAHEHYLAQFSELSELQEERPLPLEELEATCTC